MRYTGRCRALMTAIAAAFALVVAGASFFTALAFAPFVSSSTSPKLRGGGAPFSVAHGSDSAFAGEGASFVGNAVPFAAGVAVAALAMAVRGKHSGSSRVACQAAAAVAEEEAAPPPPFDPANELGVTQPLGYFDPLGFCKKGDYKTFHKLRSSELKHGRAAMMAASGTVFAHYVKFPFFATTPAGLGALGDGAGVLGLVALLLPAGFLETVYWKDDISKNPGNFGDPAKWSTTGLGEMGSYSDEMRNKEINNGRMAMFSIAGIILGEIVSGKDGVQQLGGV